MRQITFAPTFTAWQRAAREALAENLPPKTLAWEELGDDQPALSLFEEPEPSVAKPAPRFRVPRAFPEMARRVACHSDPRRWALLYRGLWRLTHGEPRLLEILVDPDIHELAHMDKAIRHDVHKMRAFVRFREVQHAGAAWFVAWFEPEHHIVELNAAFFRDRFAAMNWSILTPDRCVHWDSAHLTFTGGVAKSEAPGDDAVEALWINYYSHIFNPARVKTHAMQAEMPKKYWKNLPEAAVIPALLHQAPKRVHEMVTKSKSKDKGPDDWQPAPVPAARDLTALRAAAARCEACPLYKNATQTVFGEGPSNAPLVIVGEQPGDSEDREGHPFIGPAGQLLDRALAEAGIDRFAAYVTNAVKHFKWEPRGKRRLHQTPNSRDIAACRPWLAAELSALAPRVLLLFGGTAAKSILGPGALVLRDRGCVQASEFCKQTILTVHPSSLLRAPDEAARAEGYAQFVADLRVVAETLAR